ncbi:hypothetical protein K438DRAFT_1769506 [Mycena galopus ATCC 62051]|nr:hypothetical protein K438DRAFT_1769506 [Mycena galopus ATCC 62051]
MQLAVYRRFRGFAGNATPTLTRFFSVARVASSLPDIFRGTFYGKGWARDCARWMLYNAIGHAEDGYRWHQYRGCAGRREGLACICPSLNTKHPADRAGNGGNEEKRKDTAVISESGRGGTRWGKQGEHACIRKTADSSLGSYVFGAYLGSFNHIFGIFDLGGGIFCLADKSLSILCP